MGHTKPPLRVTKCNFLQAWQMGGCLQLFRRLKSEKGILGSLAGLAMIRKPPRYTLDHDKLLQSIYELHGARLMMDGVALNVSIHRLIPCLGPLTM